MMLTETAFEMIKNNAKMAQEHYLKVINSRDTFFVEEKTGQDCEYFHYYDSQCANEFEAYCKGAKQMMDIAFEQYAKALITKDQQFDEFTDTIKSNFSIKLNINKKC